MREYYVEGDDKSRYKDCKRIEFDEGDVCIETPDRRVFKKSNKDKLFTVEYGYQNRLDLVSWKVYGSPLYYWAIADASNILDPFDVPVGTILTCPDISVIRSL